MKRGEPTTPSKPVSHSRVEMIQLVLPNDANLYGSVLGGTVMHWIDLAAAIAAARHARRPVVTAGVDELGFLSPIRVGELAILRAQVNYASRTSMEIGVSVEAENLLTGERRHTTTAYLTFVAVDDRGRPTLVPPLLLETAEDRERHRQALERRKHRLERIKARRARQKEIP